jgi:molybdate transport system ATP-binding protein
VLQKDWGVTAETVRENLTSTYSRTLKQRRLFSIDYLIGILELGPVLDHTMEMLSAGERQRVALARSLIKSPKLLLLDDTFAGIGNSYRAQLLPILKRLQEEFGLPVVYASQSLAEILELTDQLIVLEHGQVLRSGSLREIAKQPGILSYLGIRQIDNILPVTLREHDSAGGYSKADCFGLPLVMPLRAHFGVGSQTQVSIRANDIALARNYVEGISIQNQIKGRICALIPCGESLIVQIDCGGTLLAEITPGACRDMTLSEGEIVYCLIKTHAIVYIAELDALPYQRVVNHGDHYYFLSSPGSITHPLLFE